MNDKTEIAIVGRACRLPGAPSVARLWTLLAEGRCAVTRVPADRWSLDRFSHPRQNERGRSYTWAAGVLDDIWGFDAAAFGVSPREAEQMDPQQRLLLELTWEALEDAGIPPSRLAGSETGVFVGASTNDYGNSKMFDVAATDGYFATGNAASILSNRISYIYDLNGPSFTVDTACSSSLVALEAAVQALRSGRVDTAIVGGVSIFAAPFQFINFSQASMLSRTGLCQAFSANADGYVRSEGGGILVLRTRDAAIADRARVHASIVATRVNSDGRTNGIALPSRKRQEQLLDQLYRTAGISPEDLAFVEAHGTGTPVGDPIEAMALGQALGQRRATPLPVGSIKSNIGHTEAAAGIAGILKASLALEHDLLPASLHCADLNPHIDFANLNLAVAQDALRLPRSTSRRLAGVSSYGFGGTNAHVILADSSDIPRPRETAETASVLMLSAHSRAALAAMANDYASRIEAGPEPAGTIAAAAYHRRDKLEERLVVPLEHASALPDRLRSFANPGNEAVEGVTTGLAVPTGSRIAFAFSGNGSQWMGMGIAAYAASAVFRARFQEADRLFAALSGWSLVERMHSATLAVELGKTSVAQPLIFAIQTAATAALAALGLRPDIVLGHSVGEVGAAEAAGIFDLERAIKIIYFRSLHQESVYEAGGMTVLIGSRDAADHIAETVPGATIAAYNSPRAFTFAGPLPAIKTIGAVAKTVRARAQTLDIAYPFHSPLIEPIELPLLASLGELAPRTTSTRFVSTVTGTALDGDQLDASYWWRNIREPVLFADAVSAAVQLGAGIFIEIGPSPILLSHIGDTVAQGNTQIATMSVLDRRDTGDDPFRQAFRVALARGAVIDASPAIGADSGFDVSLPSYPWQRKAYRVSETSESIAFLSPNTHHPLIGSRHVADELEWHGQIDIALMPDLADHVVDGHVLLPGAAFAEMVLAVARDWLKTATASVVDFEIQQPLVLVGGASRDIRCRVQPATGLVEIMSRPRLAQASWQTHAVAKILRQTADPIAPGGDADGEATAGTATGAEVYALAAASGLAYGPAYQGLDIARRMAPTRIFVQLKNGRDAPNFGIDPARVDACFHGLALLYRELAKGGRMKPYVPVGAGEIRLHQPGVPIHGALIEIVRSDERTIVADLTFTDALGGVVAFMSRARFQAMSAFRGAGRAIEHIAASSILASEPLAIPDAAALDAAEVITVARSLGRAADNPLPTPSFVLMEGWATATAFRLLEDLTGGGPLDLDALASQGRFPGHLEAWCRRLVGGLERSGLIRRNTEGSLILRGGADLPDARDILRALAADHPERSAEVLLAARTGAIVEALASGRYDRSRPVSTAALDSCEHGGQAAAGSANLLATIIRGTVSAWPQDRMMRILQVGHGPLTPALVDLTAADRAALTLIEPDRRRLEHARLGFEHEENLSFVTALDELAPNGFDLVLGSNTSRRIFADAAAAAALAAAMAPGAMFAAIEAAPTMFGDLVFGLHAAMTSDDETGATQTLLSEPGWKRALVAMGLTKVAVTQTSGTDLALLCVGQKLAARPARSAKGEMLIVGCGAAMEQTADALATMLRFSGIRAASKLGRAEPLAPDLDVPDSIVYLADARGRRGVTDRLMQRCLEIKALAAAIGPRKTTLWVVCPGATRAGNAGSVVEAGVWGFCRTLANEISTLDLKLIDLAPGLSADVASRRLRDVILSGTDESEIILDLAGTRVLRFGKLAIETTSDAELTDAALRLIKGEAAMGLDRLQWHKEPRTAPGRREVEIAVDAAGLNFRDVMWGLSILPEEILENGFAGATLGLECAGRIVRVGPEVTGLAVGDDVMAFAKAALATHVTVPVSVVAKRPPDMTAEAAATIPVAFLTAYYGLIRCARLATDEWVLIHGGAGGVGLAAMQIARWRGARIIATAGSPERRDLLTMLGATHVFDSRSNQFVDDVMRATGSGVDVVLNSLSGEAMERSLSVLRPFGRFVELGKRDYVANTHIGLKPFRRNLSYFGVDLDQLMLKDDTASATLFAEVMRLFGDGILSPLPYRTFAGKAVIEAFRVMQRSGHVGKIVVTPPQVLPVRSSPADRLHIQPDGTHLITGGLGGFGLETARWLVDAGARHLVLVGRSGAATADAKAAVERLRAAGATIEDLALDITDADAMAALFARFGTSLPPLAGVVHAAAVFDDSLIATMTAAKLASVVGAKVGGAAILDRLTRKLKLDYFLLYSSATTVIGNPGQGAYVAANAALEGMARRRKAAGLPALAVGWGAIQDVGVLTRSGVAATNLLHRSGVVGLAARDALDDLMSISGRLAGSSGDAVLAIADVNWAAARDHLPVLRFKTFERLMRGSHSAEAITKTKIKVKALVDERGAANAAETIIDVVVEEIARILRLPRHDVSRNKPLMEIGLDSLMAVELGMALEDRFELEAPLSASAGAMSIRELVEYIVGGVGDDAGTIDQTSADLALRHLGPEARRDVIDALPPKELGSADSRRVVAPDR